jgi:uncharacterized membrane protein
MATIQSAARGLAYFSLGLGTAQMLAPRAVAHLIGVKGESRARLAMRLVGPREIAAGVGLLTQPRPVPWLWSRVAGDVMDLGLLTLAMTDGHNQRPRVAASMAAVAGVAIVDFRSARAAGESSDDLDSEGTLHLAKAVTIRRPPNEVYEFWRNFRNLPTFMTHLESVAVIDERHSHWTARGPAGRLVEWDAEIVEERPNEFIAWRSLPGSNVAHSGSVRFSPAPGGRGTELRVQIDYALPGGRLGATVARLFGEEPHQQVQADLRKLKQVMEAGEVIRSAATPVGSHLLQRPAQPMPKPQSTGAGS